MLLGRVKLSEVRAEPLVDLPDDTSEITHDFLERADHEPPKMREERPVEADIAPKGLTRRQIPKPNHQRQHRLFGLSDQDDGRLLHPDGDEDRTRGVDVMSDADRAELCRLERDDGERVAASGEPFDADLGLARDQLTTAANQQAGQGRPPPRHGPGLPSGPAGGDLQGADPQLSLLGMLGTGPAAMASRYPNAQTGVWGRPSGEIASGYSSRNATVSWRSWLRASSQASHNPRGEG